MFKDQSRCTSDTQFMSVLLPLHVQRSESLHIRHTVHVSLTTSTCLKTRISAHQTHSSCQSYYLYMFKDQNLYTSDTQFMSVLLPLHVQRPESLHIRLTVHVSINTSTCSKTRIPSQIQINKSKCCLAADPVTSFTQCSWPLFRSPLPSSQAHARVCICV